MSRVRRDDAGLSFPDRVVQMHKVEPTAEELDLIRAIAKPIQKMNRLSQISILQALTSSPDALLAQLNNMARNGTAPMELAKIVRGIVASMPISAKLQGLGGLIDRLKKENPGRWRLVVFTGRRETQTTIQAFLERHGLKVGIINGTSGKRNQATIEGFKKNPPDCHVIVSTEAGSEGLNLQVANVLVNYDLPWNPMIVEQRIGRIQRLASEHAKVSIFNIMLRGTFEEHIVGRLIERLQMASQAIGDVEALLGASGTGGDDGATSFDERIRELVIAALAGKDVEAATRLAEKSIDDAKAELKHQKENINTMLGSMDGAEYVGPRAPTLPGVVRSMEPRDFTVAAFQSFGARIFLKSQDLYLVEENGKREHIRFAETDSAVTRSTLYVPGTAAFQRLVDRVVATGVCEVEDLDRNPAQECEDIARQWVLGFGGTPKGVEVEDVHRCFAGTALVRVRATVAHDSYERLVDVPCSPAEHHAPAGRSGLGPIARTIEDPITLGLDLDRLAGAARLDEAISEFCRFYLERREQEMEAARDDERKRKKLEDEFTPRLEMTLVAVEGTLYRKLCVRARYGVDDQSEYGSTLTVTPHTGEKADAPEFGSCSQSNRTVPKSCLKKCQITGQEVLQHLLAQSEMSSRFALPEFSVLCSLSGKRVLRDEAELSAVSGRLVANSLLKTSALSKRRAEPSYFRRCDFTNAEVLDSELATSEISGKRFRIDEQVRSAVSGKIGHKQEFLVCHETRQQLAMSEAEQCEMTGRHVRPGILEPCDVTRKRVLPSELDRCAATGKRALKRLFVSSSLSGARILEEAAVRAASGKYCAPVEAKRCSWSNRQFHPDDLRDCELTGLTIHFQFVAAIGKPRLQPLMDLLNGISRTADERHLWWAVTTKIRSTLGNAQYQVEAAVLSPEKQRLAICFEVRTWLGFRVHHIGLVYDIGSQSVIGRVARGRRTSGGWSAVNN